MKVELNHRHADITALRTASLFWISLWPPHDVSIYLILPSSIHFVTRSVFVVSEISMFPAHATSNNSLEWRYEISQSLTAWIKVTLNFVPFVTSTNFLILITESNSACKKRW